LATCPVMLPHHTTTDSCTIANSLLDWHLVIKYSVNQTFENSTGTNRRKNENLDQNYPSYSICEYAFIRIRAAECTIHAIHV